MKLARRLFISAGLGSLANLGIVLAVALRSQQSTSASPETTATETTAPEPAVESAIVTIRGFQYSPDRVVLQQGGSITFINQDSTPHTASPLDGAEFSGTGRLRLNDEITVQFETVGEFDYYCEIHPSMVGRVIVQPRA